MTSGVEPPPFGRLVFVSSAFRPFSSGWPWQISCSTRVNGASVSRPAAKAPAWPFEAAALSRSVCCAAASWPRHGHGHRQEGCAFLHSRDPRKKKRLSTGEHVKSIEKDFKVGDFAQMSTEIPGRLQQVEVTVKIEKDDASTKTQSTISTDRETYSSASQRHRDTETQKQTREPGSRARPRL